MATLYANSSGSIIGVAATLSEVQIEFSSVPVGTAFTLDFDETANVALLADILANLNVYTVTSGPTLKKNGTVITPAGGAVNSAAWRNAVTAANNVTPAQIQAAIALLVAGTASTAQTQLVAAYLLVKMAEARLLFRS